jgi:hypothetical protein
MRMTCCFEYPAHKADSNAPQYGRASASGLARDAGVHYRRRKKFYSNQFLYNIEEVCCSSFII